LGDACTVGRRRPDLADSTITTHRRRLDRELDRLLDLKPTDVEGSHLRATIAVTASDKLLVFLTRRDVAATNNESERALRPSVIFQKRRRIERLRTCVTKLEAFDLQKANNRAPTVLELEAAIDKALSSAFGYGTAAYLRYNEAATLDPSPLLTNVTV
jgi:hypothetical protein